MHDENINLSGYADDHGLLRSFSPSKANGEQSEDGNLSSLESTLCNIKDWMDKNKLKMNSSKTEFIYLGSWQQIRKCKTNSISVTGSDVSRSNSIKYLGVIVDENLRMQEHITSKCQIAARNIQYISSIRKHISVQTAKQLCYSLVLSHLDYCNVLFSGLPKNAISRLQRIQNWAGKVALQRDREASSRHTLFTLHWLPVKYRIQYKLLLFVFKALHAWPSTTLHQ